MRNLLSYLSCILFFLSLIINCNYSGGSGTISGGDSQKKIQKALQNIAFSTNIPNEPVDCSSHGYSDRTSGGTIGNVSGVDITVMNFLFINPYLRSSISEGKYYTEDSINQCVEFVYGLYAASLIPYAKEWSVYAQCQVPTPPAFLGLPLFFTECKPEEAKFAESITEKL
ncbi:TIGR04452 family lipoprotein [Leptospira dzoumogneensis]|uniref:TIGR04452 family lipoprotein n=1 Tax=Leptospira dzoumogneensis TaxID=2484904 RepID=A0A4Z1ARH5_9LEPT|nr:TIGR04452 family lipoprotein [Leptospira dzoumogneensis]TGN02867.1 TIGR04452 family lipoprotein [Leptospira dzoumogneensis]